jgi:hypothetical protein
MYSSGYAITLLHAYIDDNILYVWYLGVVGKRDVLRFNIQGVYIQLSVTVHEVCSARRIEYG